MATGVFTHHRGLKEKIRRSFVRLDCVEVHSHRLLDER